MQFFMSNQDTSLSKFLSLILRHKPQTIGLSLDKKGWANIEDLITKANHHNVPLTIESLKRIVANNDKKRFKLSEDGTGIRASQGHSIEVDLELREAEPPSILYHGTAFKNIDSIKVKGLVKGQRHHVHLSPDPKTAISVGARYGKPFVIQVQAQRMHEEGYAFYQSQNGVWLTDSVPPLYLEFE
jgi:putative RNA 2'-phosphotransferase